MADIAGNLKEDFNGDGRSDFLRQWSTTENACVTLTDITEAPAPGYPYLIQTENTFGSLAGWSLASMGDFNGDGMSDLMWQSQSNGELYEWLLSNGQQSSVVDFGNMTGWTEIATGDYTGNATSDLLWQNGSGDVYAWLMQNGRLQSSIGFGNLSGWSEIGNGSSGESGTTNLLWQSTNSGQPTGDVYEWTMSRGQRASSIFLGNLTGWKAIGSGDFNGDHITDYLWQSNSTGEVYEWQMNASGAVASSIDLGNQTGWYVEAIGDYQATGTDMILWETFKPAVFGSVPASNYPEGQRAIWTMSNGQHVTAADHYTYWGNYADASELDR